MSETADAPRSIDAKSAVTAIEEEESDETRDGKWRVFGLTWLSYVSYYLTRKNFSVAKSSIQDQFGVSTKSLGYIDMGYSAAYALGQFVWGPLADRVGPRRVIACGMLATAACSIFFGVSSTFLLFLVAFGLNGFAQSTGWSPNVKAMTGWFPAKTRGAVMGAWTTNYSFGGLIANPIAFAFLAWLGWRAAFYGPAVAVAIVGILILLFLPERKAKVTAEARAAQGVDRSAASARVLRTPLVWALGASYFFMKLARYFLWYWAPFYMETTLGYSKGLSAIAPLIFDAAGIVGAILIGYVSDRWMKGRRIPVAVMSLVCLSIALHFYSSAAPQGLGMNLFVLALCGFFLFGPDALVSATAAQDVGGPAAAATAAGIINGLGSLGQIVAGPLAPEKSANADWGLIFSLLGAGTLVAAMILAPFWRSKR